MRASIEFWETHLTAERFDWVNCTHNGGIAGVYRALFSGKKRTSCHTSPHLHTVQLGGHNRTLSRIPISCAWNIFFGTVVACIRHHLVPKLPGFQEKRRSFKHFTNNHRHHVTVIASLENVELPNYPGHHGRLPFREFQCTFPSLATTCPPMVTFRTRTGALRHRRGVPILRKPILHPIDFLSRCDTRRILTVERQFHSASHSVSTNWTMRKKIRRAVALIGGTTDESEFILPKES